MERVEVVLINYKRPDNLRIILEAFKSQTVPVFITLINVPADTKYELDAETLAKFDRVFTWTHNFGPFNRYVPLASYSHEFTYFSDDDMAPGVRCIENFLIQADAIKNFGVIGQQGRILDPDGMYKPRDVIKKDVPVEVDFVVRGYFTKSENLYGLSVLRNNMHMQPDIKLEDDLLLCVSMSYICGLQNYLIPLNKDKETKMNRRNLSEEGARNQRADHFADRTAFCNKAMELGWRPIKWKNAE